MIERPLTHSEQALLPPALASAVDLAAVRVVRRWHTPLASMMKVTIVRGDRIFWRNAPDEATTPLERAHLAHELVHVWQYRALRRSGFELLASRVYTYALDPARRFISYGYEQQASIVEDYIRLQNGAPPRHARAQMSAIADYERVIETAAGVRVPKTRNARKSEDLFS